MDMGAWYLIALALCASCCGGSARDPFGLSEINESFAQSFVKDLLETGLLGKAEEKDLSEISHILLSAVRMFARFRHHDPTQQRTMMVTFASTLAMTLVQEADKSLDLVKQMEAVAHALRQAYLDQKEEPNEDMIREVQFLVGIFLDNASTSEESSPAVNPAILPPNPPSLDANVPPLQPDVDIFPPIDPSPIHVGQDPTPPVQLDLSNIGPEPINLGLDPTPPKQLVDSGPEPINLGQDPIPPISNPDDSLLVEEESPLGVDGRSPFQDLGLEEVEKVFGLVLKNANQYTRKIIRTLGAAKRAAPKTFNLRVLVKELSSVYRNMKAATPDLSHTEAFIELLMETLISAFEVIRVADGSCVQQPHTIGSASKYVNAFNDILF